MAADVRIPAVGESITTGTIAKWHQANGATVQQGDTLLTLETDKVSNDLEAESAGVLHILVDEGEEVEIGAVVATIDPAGVGAAPAPSEDSGGEPALSTSEAESAPTEESKNSAEGVSVSPTVRKFADEQGVDLTKVEGTGRKGFITKADVEAALTLAKEGEGARELTVFKKPVIEPKVSDDEGRFTRKKMSPLRRKIATHLVNAQQSAAILTTFNECDMTAVMNMRKTLQESFKAKYGIKLGFM